MEDFLELGIEGADKLVDKHFHKVPDKYMQSDTYKPREIRKRRSRRNPQSRGSQSSSDTGTGPAEMSQNPPRNPVTSPPPAAPEYTYLPYSREQPHLRPEYAPGYVPSPPPMGQPYFPHPPQSQWQPQQWEPRQTRRYDDASDEEGYYSDRKPARRPKAVTRRSSSYHGPRSRDDEDGDRQTVARRRRDSSRDGSSLTNRARDVAHRYSLKEDVEGFFTKSPVGITGSVAGALVGGWAAKKAQVASGRDGKTHGGNPLLTALGAAVGGLAVNAVIDKYEDGKKKSKAKDEAWEEKWGDPDARRRRDGSGGRGRRDDDRSRRRRRDSDDSY